MNIVMIPSVSGGLGHIARTAALARKIVEIEPAANIEYVLEMERLRPFNIAATEKTGFPVRLMPIRSREDRAAIVHNCLGRADAIVDDTQRHLIALRQILPRAAWVSIPMYPLWDELFTEIPQLLLTDKVIWAYPPVLDFPIELEVLGDKVLRAGGFLQIENVPDKQTARERLGIAQNDETVVYAARGMAFGRDFGETVLAALFGATERLRETRPNLKLILLAVSKPDELNAPGVPSEMPDWAIVKPVVPPAEMLAYIRAADIAVTEGSNMTQEAAALETPILMIPGTIYESWILGTRLKEHRAARILWIETVAPETVGAAFAEILNAKDETARMTARAKELILSGGGVEAAARAVLKAAINLKREPQRHPFAKKF